MKGKEMHDETLRHRHGRRSGRGRGRRAGWRADPGYGPGAYRDRLASPPGAGLAGLRREVLATTAAARQVALAGAPDKAARAAELLSETRRALYRLLAGDAG